MGKVKDTAFYDILGVEPEVNETDLKKAYRKKAVQYHPDKNKSPDAEEMFKAVSKAYQVLSDPNTRAVYDKNGPEMMESMGPGVEDPNAFFAMMFGGDRFYDLIGEISLMKEMTNVADAMMTEEEKAAMEQEWKNAQAQQGGSGAETPKPEAKPEVKPEGEPASNEPPKPPAAAEAKAQEAAAEAAANQEESAPPPYTGEAVPSASTDLALHSTSASASGTATPAANSSATPPTSGPTEKKDEAAKVDRKGKGKLTPEQKKKLEELEAARKKAMEERVDMLSKKLIDRIRPYVDASNAGEKNDPETIAYTERTKKEAEDLKLESFGVELLHTIGNVYMMKSTSYLKSRKFLGIPGFFSRLKEKGAMAKDAWGLLGSAIGVQNMMEDISRMQEKGEMADEELRALEEDLTGQILLASWRGTRFEIGQVLREVCDKVLKEPGVSEEVLVKRAKAILLTGAIFKAVQPDESEEERRELERLVAEAAHPKKKQKGPRKARTPEPPLSTTTPRS